ncbi:hypothetical protein J4429_05780 [Candidatus Pacearchaeota archaeon]|nr:hypothetical protein [Candidatus Pacearchaeota archaeon]
MIIKLLGILDIFIAICFWIFGIFSLKIMTGFILILGLYLLAKGIIFVTGLSFASILDILAAIIIIIASSITMPKVIVIFTSLFLIQKGVFSMVN